MEPIPFKLTKRLKFLKINLTNEVKEPHIENNKIFIEEMDVKQDDSPFSRTGRINNAKLFILCKAIYMFDANVIKFTIMFSTEIEK